MSIRMGDLKIAFIDKLERQIGTIRHTVAHPAHGASIQIVR
ncbi:hypothetical protein [uncultured Roseibium sp.]|nr:hypothetical protein [uncultured Roseibium sp.]